MASGFPQLLMVIGKISPLIASILPLPGAGIIGQIIASTFGGDFSKPDDLAQKILKDPKAAEKIASIETNMRAQLEQIAAMHLQNNLLGQKPKRESQSPFLHFMHIDQDEKDLDSARDLLVKSYMPAVISSVVLVGFFFSIFMVMFLPADFNKSDTNILFMLFGTMTSAFSSVIAFWLGSNAGSKGKDESIANALQSSDKAANTAQEVKDTLRQTESNTGKRLDEIGKVNDQIHTLVNNNMGVQLKMNAALADRVAALTKDKNDIDAAEEAHKILDEHDARQSVVDEKVERENKEDRDTKENKEDKNHKKNKERK